MNDQRPTKDEIRASSGDRGDAVCARVVGLGPSGFRFGEIPANETRSTAAAPRRFRATARQRVA